MREEDAQEPGLEGAMQAAFGSPESRGASILDRIERLTGVTSQILLHDAPGEESPLLRVPTCEGKPFEDDSRYQIAGEIAKGGVGAVYKGRDRDLGRDVAVKVLRRKHAGSAEVLQRFVEEAQIGGQLQHPGIVPVYSLGLQPDGRPYFAMKLVKGRTLAASLRDREDPSADRRRLLRIFERVCQTMAYAHARGVIHRDLKPANVMLGTFGEALVVDWGFGKVLGRGEPERGEATGTIVTTVRSGSESMAGSVMGTPAYMPPEQALGHVEELDRQTDVFALGAILCEILTGKPPYVGAAKDLLVQASHARLDDAFARLDACGADPDLLDLAKRCLAPTRDDRPRDAGEVAEAMGTHLSEAEARAHRAELEAVRESTRMGRERDHARRERRAKRLTIGLAAAILVALLTGGGALLTKDARDRTRAARALPRVEQAMEEAVRLQGEGRWQEALAVARKARHLAGEVDRATIRRADALLEETESGLAAAEAEAQQAAKDRTLLARLEESRLQRCDECDPRVTDESYAAAFREYGVDPESLPPHEAATPFRGRGDAFAVAVAAALDDWAWLRRSKAALRAKSWKGLLDVADAVDPDPAQTRLRDLVRRWDVEGLDAYATEEAAGSLPARSLSLLGQALTSAGKAEEAVRLLESAARRHAGDPWILFNLAHALERRKRYAEAADCYSAALAARPESVEIRHRLGICLGVREEPDHDGAVEVFKAMLERRPDYGHGRAHLSIALGLRGETEAALMAAREAAGLAPEDGYARYALGAALKSAGRHEEAIVECREALRLDPRCTHAGRTLATSLSKTGRHEEAVTVLREVLRIEPDSAVALVYLGCELLGCGRTDEAIEEIRASLEMLEDPIDRAKAYNNLGLAYGEKGFLDDTIAAYREAVRLDPGLSAAHSNLGPLLLQRGLPEEAIAACREAVRLAPESAAAHGNLGLVLHGAGRYEEALEAARESVRLDPGSAASRCTEGTVLHALGRDDEAIAAYHEALRLDPALAEVHRNLGVVHAEGERWAEALAHYREAARLRPRNAGDRANLAHALMRTGRTEEAIAECRELIRLIPGDAACRLNLAILLQKVHRPDEAASAAREALRLEPESAAAHRIHAEALFRAGRDAEAVDAYREAAARGSLEAGHHNNLGIALVRLERYDQAVEAFRAAIRLDPGHARAHTNLGAALSSAGCGLEEAIALHRKALELDPECADAHANLGTCLSRAGRLEESLAAYREAVRLDPERAACWQALGQMLQYLGRPRGAADAYRQALRREPELADSLRGLGDALAVEDGVEEAARCYRQALRLDPGCARASNGLGLLAVGRGDAEGAVVAFREAVRLAPENALHHQNLGLALLLAGRPDEAEPALREAFRLRPALAGSARLAGSETARELLAGERPPGSARERLDLSLVCTFLRRFAAAARLCREAFREEPALADDLTAGHRYAASLIAVRAGCGHGRDAGSLDGEARAAWRRQGLAWLRADLALVRERIGGGGPPHARPGGEVLERWLREPELAGVREDPALAELPEEERETWRAFWKEVDEVRKLAEGR
jgi:serine/threonine-protein kinase